MTNKTISSLRETNLISDEKKIPYLTDEPKIPNFLTLPGPVAIDKYSIEGNHGQGFHPNETLSRIKSMAECMERLCLDNLDNRDFIEQSYDQSDRFVDPGLFCCYSDEQIGNREKYRDATRSQKYR